MSCSACGVEARDLEQVVHQDAEAPHVGDQQLRGPPGVGRHRRRGRLEQRTASATSAVRGVRSSWDDIGHEPPVLALGVLEPRRRSPASESAIRLKSSAQRPSSSRPPDRDACREVPVGDPRARRRPGGHRPQDAAGDEAGRDAAPGGSRTSPPASEAEPELRERVVDGARREHEVERRPSRPVVRRRRGPAGRATVCHA